MLKYFVKFLATCSVNTQNNQLLETTQCKQCYFWYRVVLDLSVIPLLGTLFCINYSRNINKLIVVA